MAGTSQLGMHAWRVPAARAIVAPQASYARNWLLVPRTAGTYIACLYLKHGIFLNCWKPPPSSLPNASTYSLLVLENSTSTLHQQQAVACSPSTWTFWERKMLCAALLAQGAPSSNNDDTVSGMHT